MVYKVQVAQLLATCDCLVPLHMHCLRWPTVKLFPGDNWKSLRWRFIVWYLAALITRLDTHTPWSQDLFIHQPSQLPREHNAQLPSRHWKLFKHTVAFPLNMCYGTCYRMYPLLWDMLQDVSPVTGHVAGCIPLRDMLQDVSPVTGHVTGCIPCYGTCYRMYPITGHVTGCIPLRDMLQDVSPVTGHVTGCIPWHVWQALQCWVLHPSA